MGTGIHGGFGATRGSAAGDAVYQSDPKSFFNYIRKRSDIDRNGVFDVVAHGDAMIIQVEHNGKTIDVDARIAAKLLSQRGDYNKGQPIRLLSCNTGSSNSGFAQNLANKLNVVVEAPTKLLWANPDGSYYVASRSSRNPNYPNLNDKGTFQKFYPGGKKK